MPDLQTPLILPAVPGWSARPTLRGALWTAAYLGAAALVTALTANRMPVPTGLFLFFAAVLLAAVRFGFWIGISSALAAFALYNFLFVEPFFTFRIARAGDLATLAAFLVVAGLTGFLAGRLREEANAAEARATVLESLSSFAAALADGRDVAGIARVLADHLGAVALGPAVVLRPEGAEMIVVAAVPVGVELDATDRVAADRAWRRGSAQEAARPGWQGGRFTFVPLVQDGEVVLVIGHARMNPQRPDHRQREEAIGVIARQGQLALERLAFAEAAEAARVAADRDALRAALLTSLSHDLRTPLATILGGITSLRELGETLPPAARADLERAIEEEAERLSRYVDNLLQMTRLQAGLTPRPVWVDPGDLLTAAVERARRAFPGAVITAEVADLPMIRSEGALIEQALFNLIDNGVKFSPVPAQVGVAVEVTDMDLTFVVTDAGPGIPAGAMDRIFAPFFRADPARPGSGLGLNVCQGIATALGGTLTAVSPVRGGRGTAMRLRLPLAAGGGG